MTSQHDIQEEVLRRMLAAGEIEAMGAPSIREPQYVLTERGRRAAFAADGAVVGAVGSGLAGRDHRRGGGTVMDGRKISSSAEINGKDVVFFVERPHAESANQLIVISLLRDFSERLAILEQRKTTGADQAWVEVTQAKIAVLEEYIREGNR